MEDLQNASKLLVKALKIREHYMSVSQQAFPTITKNFLRKNAGGSSVDETVHDDKATLEGEYTQTDIQSAFTYINTSEERSGRLIREQHGNI